jgi:hypothetical protein
MVEGYNIIIHMVETNYTNKINCTVEEAISVFDDDWDDGAGWAGNYARETIVDLSDGVIIAGVSTHPQEGKSRVYVIVSNGKVDESLVSAGFRREDFSSVDDVREYVESEL